MSSSKTVLITGATSGIGRHAAFHLARRGHRVIATGRNAAALERLREEAQGLPLDVLRFDVTDRASIAEAAAEVMQLTGGTGIDVLVNNAGFGIVAPLIETDEADLRGMYETNVFGLMAVTRSFLPSMMDRQSGRIINVSSAGGRVTLPLFGAYNSTKYAVESLSDALRREVRAFGIKVVLVEPGPIRTQFADHATKHVNRGAGAGSYYAALYERADRLKEQTDALSADPIVVSRAIEHAVRSRWPRTRYVVPTSTRFFVALASLFPTRWVDAVMAGVVGLTRRGLRLGAPAPIAAPVRGGASDPVTVTAATDDTACLQ